jgi:ribosomal protein S18 acetylase RimI-like enzyme
VTAPAIEALRPGDAGALARFFAANDDAERRRRFHPFPFTAETAGALCAHDGRDGYWVARHDGEIVGLSMLRGLDEGWPVPSFGVIVARAHRAAGLGRRLTEHALAEARRMGCESVRLSVYASNEPAIGLYGRLGFVEVERSEALVDGEREWRVVMVRRVEKGAGQ